MGADSIRMQMGRSSQHFRRIGAAHLFGPSSSWRGIEWQGRSQKGSIAGCSIEGPKEERKAIESRRIRKLSSGFSWEFGNGLDSGLLLKSLFTFPVVSYFSIYKTLK